MLSVQDIAVQSQALINVKDSIKVHMTIAWNLNLCANLESTDAWVFELQEDRERLVAKKFKFEEPRIEQIQDLEVCTCTDFTEQFLVFSIVIAFMKSILLMHYMQNDMTKYFREDVHRRLLSTDFKKQVDGLEILQKVYFCYSLYLYLYRICLLSLTNVLVYAFQALPTIKKEIIEVLDILLRWFVLQFCKSNTTCLLKVWSLCFRSLLFPSFLSVTVSWVFCSNHVCSDLQVLEFLPDLFDTFRDEAYMLTESEAAIFFPCLIEKVSIFIATPWKI